MFYSIVSGFHLGKTNTRCDFGLVLLRLHFHSDSWRMVGHQVWWEKNLLDWYWSNVSPNHHHPIID